MVRQVIIYRPRDIGLEFLSWILDQKSKKKLRTIHGDGLSTGIYGKFSTSKETLCIQSLFQCGLLKQEELLCDVSMKDVHGARISVLRRQYNDFASLGQVGKGNPSLLMTSEIKFCISASPTRDGSAVRLTTSSTLC